MAPTLSDMIEQFAEAIVSQLLRRLPASALQVTPTGSMVKAGKTIVQSTVNGGGKAYKRDMRCRWPRCFHLSKGPRMGYFCEKHIKEPEAEKKKAAQEYKARRAHVQRQAA